ncbi:uncharacterized protein LOC141537152 [Cotesia typhae]|uniref:uncharacterized protein LOC141537152 n=1 Tax=Cotesia typhae TaxID=2053667 RepID=UPI003D690B2C
MASNKDYYLTWGQLLYCLLQFFEFSAIYDQRFVEGLPGILYEQFFVIWLFVELQRPNRQPTSHAMPRFNRIAVLELHNFDAKNPGAPAEPTNRQRCKHYVRKNRGKKHRGAVKGVSNNSRFTSEASGIILTGTEPAVIPIHPGDNLPYDHYLRDINIQPGLIVKRLYRGLAEGQESVDIPAKGHSSERVDSYEHLKLEEAHLSAPLAVNLVSSLLNDRPHSSQTVKGSLYSGKIHYYYYCFYYEYIIFNKYNI